VAAAGDRPAGQPAQPPDDRGHDENRQPDHRAVLEDGGPDGSEADGGARPGQFGPLLGQPGGAVLGVIAGRVQWVLTPDTRAITAAARPMAVMAMARIWGRRERGSGCPWRSARWLVLHSE
jgi:hypothetical protein